MQQTNFCKAYVQGDWVASDVSGERNPRIGASYERFLDALRACGIENVASWHTVAKGVFGDLRRTDVLRNCREIDGADCVITFLQNDAPPNRHWGSIALMMYAAGKGKPSYVVAADTCCVWESHTMYHPLITRCATPEALMRLIGEPKAFAVDI